MIQLPTRPRLTALATLLGIALLGCANAGAGVAPATSIERGRQLAERSCAGCHALDPLEDRALGRAPALYDVRLRLSAASLHRRLKDMDRYGHDEMPPMDLSADEIDALIEYLDTMRPGFDGASAAPEGPSPLRPVARIRN
jgi:mono/diheme cytochrome c family protein